MLKNHSARADQCFSEGYYHWSIVNNVVLKKKSLNVKIYKLGAKPMPTVESAVHLGIIRTTSLTENMTINVEENIKKARRSAYGRMFSITINQLLLSFDMDY
jgi:hypothetical protein